MSNILQSAAKVFERDGVAGLGRKVVQRFAGGSVDEVDNLYQAKVALGIEERWSMISKNIPAGSTNLLDLGCNLAQLTARAAQSGYWSIGLEKMQVAVDEARRLHAGAKRLGILQSDLQLEDCQKLPEFDVIMTLSVHHHWHYNYSPAIAAQMLQTLADKTKKAMFFEGPSRTTRFEKNIPDFLSNDPVSVSTYHLEYLKSTVGTRFAEIRMLGKTPCVGDREPYRWLFLLCK